MDEYRKGKEDRGKDKGVRGVRDKEAWLNWVLLINTIKKTTNAVSKFFVDKN